MVLKHLPPTRHIARLFSSNPSDIKISTDEVDVNEVTR